MTNFRINDESIEDMKQRAGVLKALVGSDPTAKDPFFKVHGLLATAQFINGELEDGAHTCKIMSEVAKDNPQEQFITVANCLLDAATTVEKHGEAQATYELYLRAFHHFTRATELDPDANQEYLADQITVALGKVRDYARKVKDNRVFIKASVDLYNHLLHSTDPEHVLLRSHCLLFGAELCIEEGNLDQAEQFLDKQQTELDDGVDIEGMICLFYLFRAQLYLRIALRDNDVGAQNFALINAIAAKDANARFDAHEIDDIADKLISVFKKD